MTATRPPDGAPAPARSYRVRTFGCQMNVHDSERLSGLLEAAGYVRAADDDGADVVVLNTCAVRETRLMPASIAPCTDSDDEPTTSVMR